MNPKLSYAIAGILGSSSFGYSQSASSADGNIQEIQEVTVTAQRRAESLQDVPVTIQALTGGTLEQLTVTTLDDFIRYLPNVTQASNGPGQSFIFMRGLSLPAQGGTQNLGTNGQIPTVAVYLDDQSASLPGRNLDVYAADLERIEVLEGPQGTLFGSGAEAGVLRYITNKPKLDVTEGVVNAAYSYTSHGDPNGNLDAALNLPLVPDKLAIRGVVYVDRRGGYINNLPSTFTRAGTDRGLANNNNGIVPADSVAINNNNVLGDAINPLTYQGVRVSLLYKINDDWNALLAQSYQDMNAQGVFYQMPFGSEGTVFDPVGKPIGSLPLPPLSVNLFNPSYNKDRFSNTALTITGKIGDLKAVYAAGYLDRNVDQRNDYTNYARGVYGDYYQCVGLSSSATSPTTGKCYTPSAIWHEKEKNTHQSHEVRLSTPEDWRIRVIGGIYYERFIIEEDSEFLYKTVPTCSATVNVDCFNNVQAWPDAWANNPGPRNDNVAFIDNIKRTIDQKAAFASVDLDVIPRTLTVSLGTRYYRFDQEEVGGAVSSFGCKVFAPTTYFGVCTTPGGTNLNLQVPNTSKYTGFRSRATLSWKANEDVLVYYTWSQGFRPGGFNQGSAGYLPDSNGVNQFFTPLTYAPDTLTNSEVGFKTLWLDRRLQLNGSIYQETWKNAQSTIFDPQNGLGNIGFSTNGPDYRVRGVELQVISRIGEGLTIQGSLSYNDTKQTNSPFLINNNPASESFGQPITAIPNAFGPKGSPLANSPLLQWNIRVRDEIPLGQYKGFWQIGAQHIGDSLSATGNVPAFQQPGYTTYDAAVGISKDAWRVELFGQNLTSVNASAGTNAGQFVQSETVIRPRVAGVKIGYRF